MSRASTITRLVVTGAVLSIVPIGCRSEAREGRASRAQAELIAEPEVYTGLGLAAKQLVFTFDDGPNDAAITGALSTWLKARPKPIHAVFFVNGACIGATTLPNSSCGDPTPGAAAVLTQLVDDGHLIGNHTTTHRDMTAVPAGQRVQELQETDTQIAPYVPWNRWLFRAPFGFWNAQVQATVSASAMNKYVGPIYWSAGGGPTDANKAADWECWELGYTSRQCGDLYLKEIRAVGKGIVLMHDRAGSMDESNHDINAGTGNIVDMVKYIVPILDSEGFTYKSIEEDPQIGAVLPSCHPSCLTCAGPTDAHCISCPAGKFNFAGRCTPCGTCKAGMYQSKACQPTADTVCSACDPSCTVCAGPDVGQCNTCLPSFYVNGDACSACSVCEPGTSRTAACTSMTNTVCAPCAAGTFASEKDAATCAPCAEGTFSAAGAASCTACGSCDDGNVCTADACSNAGCTHTAIAGCSRPGAADGGSGATPEGPEGDGGESGCSIGRARDLGSSRSSFPRAFGGGTAFALSLVVALRRRRRNGRAGSPPTRG